MAVEVGVEIAVLGGGVAGLAAALILRRDGHDVTLIERDDIAAGTGWTDAFEWERRGIPHFFQPHAFLPRGAREMEALLPDVYARLLDNGAHPWLLGDRIPGDPQPADERIRGIAVRRPLIEWALRAAAVAEPGLTIRSNVTATGLILRGAAVAGVTAGGEDIPAAVVVDAMGRSSPVPSWIEAAGLPAPVTESNSCDTAYYSRYYRVHGGQSLPEYPGLVPPRADFGYAAVASFPGDNGTFGLSFSVLPHDAALKGLRDEGALERVLARVPQLAAWRAAAEPITAVLPISGLRNSFRDDAPGGDPLVPGLFAAGDAYCHTNPIYALGLSFSFVHPGAIAHALRLHPDDPAAAGKSYIAATREETRERFEYATIADEERARRWGGEPIDLLSRTGSKALFPLIAPAIAGAADAQIARAWLRRLSMLDRLSVMTSDDAMMERVERIARDLMAKHPPPPLPSRDQMIALIDG